MDLATGAMGSLLRKLGNLLMEEYKLQAGVKEDIEYMKRELTSIYTALRKVGDVPRDQLDEQVKGWADEVRDLSYMMEDIIDKFLVSVEGVEPAVKPHKLKRLMKKMGDLFTKNKNRHEIADEIEGIKVRVQEAEDRRVRYKVNDVVANPAGAAIVDPRLLALFKDKKDLVGLDGPRDELANMLSDGHGDMHKQLKIVSIFGFGGLGKTTLAKALYDKVQSPYDCSAFVPVGRTPSVKKVLNDILFAITERKQPELDERELIDKLRGLLKNKRYFIVIDDIWDTETWDIVNCALVDNNCASRILTTTRILHVATKTGEVYRLEPLSRDLSEDLFHSRLFGGNSKCSSDLPAEVYEKILHKCGGVPLAIITIASLLVSKPMELWSKVYNSIGFGHEDNNKDVENTRNILLFSYYDLPCHLRTCLLHLSIYPEDSLIEKDNLIWLWVGEGFIPEEQGVGLYEIGERYFNELINKSMLVPVEDPGECITIGCRVHDLVLDMICLLAKEGNFVTLFGKRMEKNELPQSIGLLSQLKCLNAPQVTITVEQDWIGNLTSLQELCVFDTVATQLGKLTELRKLFICGRLDLSSVSLVQAWAETLVKLQKIQVIDVARFFSEGPADVTLECYVPPQQLRVFRHSYKLPGLYASITSSSLPYLTHLSVHVGSPNLEIFGRFPELVSLSLDTGYVLNSCPYMGGAGVGLFPKLRVYNTNWALPGPFLPGAMPNLESLKFSVALWTSRDGNIHFDFGSLMNLPMLQKVTIKMLSGERIKDEDWHKAHETVTQQVNSHPSHPVLDIRDYRGFETTLDDPDSFRFPSRLEYF